MTNSNSERATGSTNFPVKDEMPHSIIPGSVQNGVGIQPNQLLAALLARWPFPFQSRPFQSSTMALFVTIETQCTGDTNAFASLMSHQHNQIIHQPLPVPIYRSAPAIFTGITGNAIFHFPFFSRASESQHPSQSEAHTNGSSFLRSWQTHC